MSTLTTKKPTSRNAAAGIRKAAILVSALDRDAVNALLDQMGPDQASLVRQAIIELDDVDAVEQDRVIEEFIRLGKRPSGPEMGVELDKQLEQRLSAPSRIKRTESNSATQTVASGKPSFEFLNETEIERLASILLAERPQTIAVVLSHMPHERAGHVLVKLPDMMQADVVRRLVDLEETDPDILLEVEQELQDRLSRQIQMERRRVAGEPAVAGILAAADSEVGSTILKNLAAQDRGLAQRFANIANAAKRKQMQNPGNERFSPKPAPVHLEFNDLATLDADTLCTITENVQTEILVLALLGAPSHLSDRVLRQMPTAHAAAIRNEIENIGPIRLGDVEEARRRLIQTIQQLHADGRIKLEATGHEASRSFAA